MIIGRDERFLATTRGQVVTLLRYEPRTVNELADALGLTDNAVRSHLAVLERDGLVRRGEPRRGAGKPSFTYELTHEADRLFPKADGLLLHHLLGILTERLPSDEINRILREVGHRVAAGQAPPRGELRHRVDRGLAFLNELGGLAEIQAAEGGFVIQSTSCPLATAVAACPDACYLAESLLTDVIGVPVRQTCEPGATARCRFEIDAVA
jgi:predicted ArsR family transcriptional regulator